MVVHQIYAQIFEETVQNIIVCPDYEMANYLSRAAYGESAFSIECTQFPCNIGDKYKNGTFYYIDQTTNKEIELKYIPTEAEQVAQLQSDKELLEEEIINTQLALTELFENMEG